MLERIRRALGRAETATPPSTYLASQFPPPPSTAARTELVQLFCDELAKVGGRVCVVASSDELKSCLERILAEKPASVAVSDVVATTHEQLLKNLQISATEIERDLFAVDIGITTADYAIADTGTLVLLSGGERHRLLSLLPSVHICLLDSERIFPNLSELLRYLHEHVYSNESSPQATTFITGPSRTADIEQTLTTGVHGPCRVEVMLTIRRCTEFEAKHISKSTNGSGFG